MRTRIHWLTRTRHRRGCDRLASDRRTPNRRDEPRPPIVSSPPFSFGHTGGEASDGPRRPRSPHDCRACLRCSFLRRFRRGAPGSSRAQPHEKAVVPPGWFSREHSSTAPILRLSYPALLQRSAPCETTRTTSSTSRTWSRASTTSPGAPARPPGPLWHARAANSRAVGLSMAAPFFK
jgi:hypothetical protein